jgi:cysteine desulfurase
MPVYLDCAATTPIDPRVRDEVLRYLDEDFGNAGSRTHVFGRIARAALERARDRVAAVVAASRGDVVFTSGATESNNLAILGLARHAEATERRHIVSTGIEHHAVLEPVAQLGARGFAVDLVAPEPGGAVDPDAILRSIRPETGLVSVMHVNNETGVVQPIDEIARGLSAPQFDGVYFHVDAAQSFGRELDALTHSRIDLISISGHKIHAPKGVGALIARRRDGARPPLEPLSFGGGQERGLRPGTLPVALIAGLGLAAQLAAAECGSRRARTRGFRARLLAGLAPLRPIMNGDASRSVPHIVNLSIQGVDADAAIEAWEDLAAVAHGAACTSQQYTCSHVLTAMGIPDDRADGALRLSWCHLTELPDLDAMVAAIAAIRQGAGRLAL